MGDWGFVEKAENLANFVSAPHQVEFARKLSSEPKEPIYCFKTILKPSNPGLEPYLGTLLGDKSGTSQLKAYKQAFFLLNYLKSTDTELYSDVTFPKWMISLLFSQSEDSGGFKEMLRADQAPGGCSHNRKVRFDGCTIPNRSRPKLCCIDLAVEGIKVERCISNKVINP